MIQCSVSQSVVNVVPLMVRGMLIDDVQWKSRLTKKLYNNDKINNNCTYLKF